MSRKVDVVVAWYRENLYPWLTPLLDLLEGKEQVVRVFVYAKGGCKLSDVVARRVREQSVENKGREAETWLRYVLERFEYGDFPDSVIFLQGNPLDHSVHGGDPEAFAEALAREVEKLVATEEDRKLPGPVVVPALCEWYVERTKPHCPQRLLVHQAFEKAGLSEGAPDASVWDFRFAAGAQYVLINVAETILRRPDAAWWRRLYELLESDEINAWEIERMWEFIFNTR